MIISDLYQTNITCSNYNAKIDSGDGSTTITVTVKLEDFNKAPVSGKNVALTVDKGYFKSVTGTSTTNYSNTTTKSVSATTKSDGTISAVYVPSEWGLATFSANNVNSQIIVKGWKKIYDSNNTTAWINDEYFRVGVADYSLNLAKNTGYTNKITVTGLSPDIYYYSNTGSSVIEARLTTEGKIQFRNNHASNDYSNTISTTFFGKLND